MSPTKDTRSKAAQPEGVKVRRARRRIYEDPDPAVAGPASAGEPPLDADPAPAVHAAPDPEGDQASRRAWMRRTKAMEEVYTTVAWTTGVGFLPLPLIDTAAFIGLIYYLVRRLCRLYGKDFSSQRAYAVTASLLGGVGSVSLVTGVFGSMVRGVPGVGPALDLVALPATAGAVTYGLGKVFIHHFEAGGTLLDLDPEKLRGYYREQVREGRGKAAVLRRPGR